MPHRQNGRSVVSSAVVVVTSALFLAAAGNTQPIRHHALRHTKSPAEFVCRHTARPSNPGELACNYLYALLDKPAGPE